MKQPLGARLHRRLAWLALCAMVFAALAPSVSKLLTASSGVTWVEVCSASGTRWVALGGVDSQRDDAPTASDKHCGYCVLQQHSPALPAPAVAWEFQAPSAHRLAIGPGGTTNFARFTRSAHLTRGPPTFS